MTLFVCFYFLPMLGFIEGGWKFFDAFIWPHVLAVKLVKILDKLDKP